MKTINRDKANPNSTMRVKSLLIEARISSLYLTVKLFLLKSHNRNLNWLKNNQTIL